MQVSVESMGPLERKLTVQVPEEEIQQKVDSKLRELSKQVRIKGFRPGRVPMNVVRQRYGRQVRLDIVNETMQTTLQQAIAEQELQPATMPRVDAEPASLEGGDLEYSAVVEVYPEVETLDVSSFAIEKPEANVSEADVDEMLETLREQRKEWSEVERKPVAGDRVLLEYAAETASGRVPEEGTQRMGIIMGDSGFEELESAVADIAPGGEATTELTFPDDFREPSLSGATAKVELKAVSVEEGRLPEVDEDFIRGFGIESGELEDLRTEVRANLERELDQSMKRVLKNRLVDELLKTFPDLDVPRGVVREEATGMAAQLLPGQSTPPPETLVDQFMEQAEERVRAGLLLGALASQNDIRVDAVKVREAIDTVANTYEQPEEVVRLYYGNQRLLQQVESSVLEEQVVDWVLENAKVTTQEMSFQDVIAAAQGKRDAA